MIKCNVTVNGVISRAATMRSGSEGNQFISFSVKVSIPGKPGNKEVEISVSKDGTESEIPMYVIGKRIEVSGILSFRKREDKLYLNLRSESVNLSPQDGKSGIEGTLEFKGTIGKQVEEKTDRKGNTYITFSAFSAEKNGEDFAYTWVRFIRFSSQKESFLTPKSKIQAKGRLELSAYNDNIGISCRIDELSEYHGINADGYGQNGSDTNQS